MKPPENLLFFPFQACHDSSFRCIIGLHSMKHVSELIPLLGQVILTREDDGVGAVSRIKKEMRDAISTERK